jgi:hypothetical protein
MTELRDRINAALVKASETAADANKQIEAASKALRDDGQKQK